MELDNAATVPLQAPNRPAYHRGEPGGRRTPGIESDGAPGLLYPGTRVPRRGGGPPPAGAQFNGQNSGLKKGLEILF